MMETKRSQNATTTHHSGSESNTSSSASSSPVVWSRLATEEDETEWDDDAESAMVDSEDGEANGEEKQPLGGNSSSSSSSRCCSIGKELVMTMSKQLIFAWAIGRMGPTLGRILYTYQCHHGLSERPPPYDIDEDSGDIVLYEHLNHPKPVASAVSGTQNIMDRRVCRSPRDVY